MKVKIIALWAVLSASVGIAFSVALALTDQNWFISVGVAAVAVVGARSVYRWWLSTQTNRSKVVGTEHGVTGPIEAIEVFWRPG